LWINGTTEAHYELAAWKTSHLMRCWSSEAPSIDQLLCRERDDEILRPADFATLDDFNLAVEASRSKQDPLCEP